MPIILFINLKGGVAKTATAVAIAECFAANGNKTLLIDADHQCAASELLIGADAVERADSRKHRKTLHDLLASMLSDEFETETIQQYLFANGSNIGGGLPSLSVLPCSLRIDDFQTNVSKARPPPSGASNSIISAKMSLSPCPSTRDRRNSSMKRFRCPS